MLNKQIDRLYEVAQSMAKERGGQFIEQENATVYANLVEAVRKQLPNNAVLDGLPQADKETRWQTFLGMVSQLKGVSDYITFAN